MKIFNKIALFLLAITFISAATLSGQAISSKSYTTQVLIEQYLDLVISGNLETAQYLWWPESRERANKFGIEYDNVMIKMDCNSPIFTDFNVLRDNLYPPVQRVIDMPKPDSNYYRLSFNKSINGKHYQHSFYVRNEGEYNYIIYPQDYYAARWPVIETRYYKIHCHPAVRKYLNPVALEEADKYIEETGKKLKLDDDDMKLLEEKKIDYFYCDIDSTVKEITGKTTKGLFDLASNDIISANFPHFHELTHLLVNLKLKHLPLYTLPLFQEGLAVKYGGRWGKNVAALDDIGIFIYKENLIDFDSSITLKGFSERSGADIAYPVAGLFNEFLLTKLDIDKYFKLYREASGDVSALEALTTPEIQDMITAATGYDNWDDCIKDFNAYLDEKINENPGAQPGTLEGGDVIYDQDNIKVRSDKKWLAFEVTFPAGEPMVGNFQFGYDDKFGDKKSSLFDEHYQGLQDFEDYRFGFRFDTNEAGIYDYGSNQLMAKYIFGITPSDNYFDSTANVLTVMFNREIFEDKKIPELKKNNFLPL